MLTKEKVIEALKQCNDPELDMNVWFLGLIYDIQIHHENVKIKMTFTTMFCPYGPSLVDDVKRKVTEAGAKQVDVEVVFEPKWEPSEDVKMALGV
jgi:metal-sulfur cluster biosynthetic enzyme